MLAAARLVVDRPEDVPGEPPGEPERPVEVAEVLRGQPPEHRGTLAHRHRPVARSAAGELD